ncbi:GTP cyclohydrolase II [Chondromyces apiculatus]|uniref:GTP cyclohydrolase-2 n=1 Tax=Chondromyces apiculatus DSM 436 TaxID=1192034 RepID=A0A017TI15_9BACT|nr:GTP cyclohydrolase II [Chondromyces apiculatus]EYF08475.1 GTP cyclohydrolase II [Chondromyces apiculatus DSM 436]
MHVPTAVIRPQLVIGAQAPVPTRYGMFEMVVFRWGDAPDPETGLSPDHVALIKGDVRGQRGVTVRVHSECLTSEVFGSLKCDCREQLEAAQEEIARRGQGVVLYLRQEGRGIGLANKIRAYGLQARGHDTVDANRLLGLPDDARMYEAAAAMIAHLGIASIRLLTNNPEKIEALSKLGVQIVSRAPSIIQPNPFSAPYLDAKRRRMGHALPSEDLTESALGEAIGDAE